MASIPLTFLNQACIDNFDIDAFKRARPFPWANPQGMLTQSGHQQLLENLPLIDDFSTSFGKRRRYNQVSHNRYMLAYRRGMALCAPWQAFIDELTSDYYRNFVAQLLGKRAIRLEFHWHYTPNGCSVSPHCDVKSKLGTHIFYMNTQSDWQPEWGGQTVLLDDDQQLSYRSNPDFEAFADAVDTQTENNRSLIFQRTDHSWHGVRPIHCPNGHMRKIFAITYTQFYRRCWYQLKPSYASLC